MQQPDSARHYAGAALAALTVGAGNASPLTAEAQTLVDSLTPDRYTRMVHRIVAYRRVV
ncbi:MAG TPA: hypothetical protein VFJ92_11720 [Gemmatimonadales bacterium]|nr:hypothetical protein [Gemmatimonadales bacterium]